MRDVRLLEIAKDIVNERKPEILKLLGIPSFQTVISESPFAYIYLLHDDIKYTGGSPEPRMLIAEFGMAMLDGCCGVVVSYYVLVSERYRAKGLGQLLLDIRQRAILEAGYTVMMATSINNNFIENHILFKNGFKPMNDFVNYRTVNKVVMWQKNLRAPKVSATTLQTATGISLVGG